MTLKSVLSAILGFFLVFTAIQVLAKNNPNTANSNKNIIVVLSSERSLGTLVEALKTSDLVNTLTGPGPFTVFIPDNQAFAKIKDYQALLAKKQKLADILKYHIVPGELTERDLVKDQQGKPLTTLQGQSVTVTGTNGKLLVNGVRIIKGPIKAANGIIYIIDAVLVPKIK